MTIRRQHDAAREDLCQYIERVHAEWNNVGVAVAVVHGNEVICTCGFGLCEVNKPAKVDEHTLFQIGSTTKAITGAAMGILVDDKRVDWDDPVIAHVPEFQLRDPWLTRNITIRDTLTHRSGISGGYYASLAVVSSLEVLRQLRYVEADAPFRDSYRYSNVAYAVAGRVIEAASQQSWADFLRMRLLGPLKMNRTGTSPLDVWNQEFVAPTFLGSLTRAQPSYEQARLTNVAMPHVFDAEGSISVLPWQSYDNEAAAGALVSNASDLASWLAVNLNSGAFEGRQIVQPGTMQELHSIQNLRIDAPQFPFEEVGESYAVGWRRSQYGSDAYLGHGGGITGFPAYIGMLLGSKIGVAVLSNGPQTFKYSFHKAIVFGVLDKLIGSASRDWIREFRLKQQLADQQATSQNASLDESRPKRAPPSLPLEAYQGVYENRQEGAEPAAVQVEDGRLVLRFAGDGAYAAILEPWAYEHFRLRSSPGANDVLDTLGQRFLSFSIDPTGRVVSLRAFDVVFQRIA